MKILRPQQEQLPEILYHKDHIGLAWKPGGFLVHAAERGPHAHESDLEAFVCQQVGMTAHLLHRLDYEVSGLVLFATKKSVAKKGYEALSRGLIRRHYHALVSGLWPKNRRKIHSFVGRLKGKHHSQNSPFEGSKLAKTQIRVLGACAQASALELEALTGRSHQLRLHCQAVGHPILGESAAFFPNMIALHCARISWTLEADMTPLVWACPSPTYWRDQTPHLLKTALEVSE